MKRIEDLQKTYDDAVAMVQQAKVALDMAKRGIEIGQTYDLNGCVFIVSDVVDGRWVVGRYMEASRRMLMSDLQEDWTLRLAGAKAGEVKAV